MENLKDQYGNPLPTDLVLLEANDITIAEAERIESLDWYCVGNKGGIFVSAEKIEEIIGSHDFASIQDVFAAPEVLKVDNTLKRWNDADGFYHA